MDIKDFREWIGRIYATDDDELDCNQLQSQLPAAVDAEVDHYPLPAPVEQHLTQCPDCREVYEGLRAVAALEAEGRLHQEETPARQPGSEELTPIPGS